MNPLLRFAITGLGLTISLASHAYTIQDKYIGSNDHGYGDVIASAADKSTFDIKGMDAAISGTVLSVTVNTDFGTTGLGTYKPYTYSGQGIGAGDLFLSNQWNPYGSASNGYAADNASNGTHWLYGLSLDNRWSASGGTATLYTLPGADSTNHNPGLKTSDDFIKNAIYRNGQAVAVDKSKAIAATDNNGKNITGSWLIDSSGNLHFSIDLAFSGLLANNQLALRWEETCANDAIEGSMNVPHEVPEPGSLALMALGLFGLLLRRRPNRT